MISLSFKGILRRIQMLENGSLLKQIQVKPKNVMSTIASVFSIAGGG